MTVELYHGTSARHLESIARDGLKAIPPERNWDISRACVYLAMFPSSAWMWARGDKVVLKVTLTDAQAALLRLDRNVEDDPYDPIFFEYAADIPPEAISVGYGGDFDSDEFWPILGEISQEVKE